MWNVSLVFTLSTCWNENIFMSWANKENILGKLVLLISFYSVMWLLKYFLFVRERKRERPKNIYVRQKHLLATSCTPPTRRVPRLGPKLGPLGLWDNAQSTEPHWPGTFLNTCVAHIVLLVGSISPDHSGLSSSLALCPGCYRNSHLVNNFCFSVIWWLIFEQLFGPTL